MSVTDDAPQNITVRKRSTRDRPAKAPLSEEAIIDAALAILKSEGLDAVTMRTVATSLDTGAASLYVYVSGRRGLLEGMLDRVTASIRLEPPSSTRWRLQLHSLLQRVYQALVDYPGIAAVTLPNSPVTNAILLLTENLLGILLAGEIDPQDAAWGCDILVQVVMAAAREDDVRRPDGRGTEMDRQNRADELYRTFVGLSPLMFPLISAHAAQMAAGTGDERFRFAIDVVVDGMLARASGGEGASSRPTSHRPG
jgi:AcrR family transcriptional regulator